MNRTFIACIGLALAVGFYSSTAVAAPGVCITGEINLDGVAPGTCLAESDLPSLFDKPVKEGQNKSDGLNMTHPDDYKQQKRVRTCREFDSLRDMGWYALSTADMAAEGWFERACGTLRVILGAAAPKKTLLDRPDKGLSDPAYLSAQILPLPPEAKRAELEKLVKPGATVADLVKSGAVKILSAKPKRLELSYHNQHAIYEELAIGDFDRDGMADALVFLGVHASGGSMQWYQHLGLSRSKPRGVLTVIFKPEA